jgi:hypothetical protein
MSRTGRICAQTYEFGNEKAQILCEAEPQHFRLPMSKSNSLALSHSIVSLTEDVRKVYGKRNFVRNKKPEIIITVLRI